MSLDGKFDLESIVDSSRVSSYQIMTICLCAFVTMIDGFDTQSIAFVAPSIAAAWQVELSAFGPVFGAGLFGGMIGAMIFGLAGDRFGRKPTLLFTVALFAAGSLITPLVESISQLSAIRFITGVGLGGALPIVISLTAEYAPERMRATSVAVMFCGFPFGAVVGGFLSAKLIPDFGWASVFIIGGGVPLLALPLLIAFVPESVRFLALRGDHAAIAQILKRMKRTTAWNGESGAGAPEIRAPISSLFKHGRALGTVLLWTTIFLSLMLSYFLINWIPLIVRQTGQSTENAVLAVVMTNMGAIGGCIVLGRLADRFGRPLIIGGGYALGAVAIALMGRAGQSSSLLFFYGFVGGFLTVGAQMCAVALCASFYETRLRATGVGWTMGVGRIGAIVGPVLGGLLIGAGIAAPTLFVIAGLTSFGAAIAIFAMGWFVLRARSSEAGMAI